MDSETKPHRLDTDFAAWLDRQHGRAYELHDKHINPAFAKMLRTIGFDKGQRLVGFSTRVRQVERIDMDRGGGVRPFLATEHPPELGRSGGGLFRADGALVGVCVARAEFPKGRKIGLFSTLGNVKALIRSHEDLAAAVARANVAAEKARSR